VAALLQSPPPRTLAALLPPRRRALLPPLPARAAELALPADIVAALSAAGCAVAHSEALTPEILGAADVLYVTRVQKERFSSAAEYERLKLAYVVGAETMAALAPRAIVMHPLPRVGEIKEEVDADPRAVYFRQMRYGLFVRMALLALVMGVTPAAVSAEADAARAQ
jgi:carbamoyl-phosphate synthase/aspartate carbamoyltransferase